MARTKARNRGRDLARFLAGAWRSSPAPVLPPEWAWEDFVDFLLETGCGSLGWWRIRSTDRANDPLAQELCQAYRLHAVQASLHDIHIQQVVEHLRDGGIEPILFKGWAVSRLYPDAALRPFGDIDLAVAPDQLDKARDRLLASRRSFGPIDLHAGLPDLGDRQWQQIVSRSALVTLGQTAVRIPSPEDHFRLLCLHMLRHGAWRPLWLCDIAVSLDQRGSQFDWDQCLSGDQRLSEWVLAAVGLACRLLDAVIIPDALRSRAHAMARRLVGTVLRQWGSRRRGDSHSRDDRRFVDSIVRPSRLCVALRMRWPNPIEAAMRCRGRPQSGIPWWLYQSAAFMQRAARLALRLPKELRSKQFASSVTIHSSA